MTNKEFQKILAVYPDDYIICMDNVFGWESVHNMIEPCLYINSDIGQIEIEPDEWRNPWNDVKDKLPNYGELIIASHLTDSGNRMYETIFYPEPPLTDKMDKWMAVPTLDKF